MELKQLFTQIWVNVLLYLILGKVWNYMMNSGSSNNLFGNFGLNKQDYYVGGDNSLDSLMNVFNNKTEFKSEGLDEVIGLSSVKEELYYYFDFINNANRYKDWNVQIPRGVLLVGPPGTGKTLLVKSIAKNSGIPVIHSTGSDFVEMFVGLGASRIRSLFNQARSLKKCIIFIDEIDAVGKKRGMDHNSEREQTLNQLLTEMDGFKEISKEGKGSLIMVFAATNLVKDLDPALLRSGRFDKKVYFDLPNKEERNELFKLYIMGIDEYKKSKYSNSSLNDNFNTTYLSELSVGLSGADISNVINQAKINAIKNKKVNFNNSDIVFAIDEVMIGREKPERRLSEKELVRVSYHEAGHAFMSLVLDGLEPPIKVSILPRGEAALGFSMQRPVDIKLYTEIHLVKQILVLLSGRSTEKIFFNSLSSGAYDDIEKVTRIIQSYFKDFGMSKKYGPLNFNNLGKNNLDNFGRYNINQDIIKFISEIEKLCIEILSNNKESLIKIADLLLKKETIDYNDLYNAVNHTLENSVKLEMVDEIYPNDTLSNILNMFKLI
tara:strand:+ start:2357 stop:4003 length:1647 start_codon:yes stop_codon:yes gene_type:complete